VLEGVIKQVEAEMLALSDWQIRRLINKENITINI